MKTKSHPTARTPAGSIPRKWRWHSRALQALRDHLVDDLRLKLAAAAEPIEPHSMDPADSATDESDRTLAVSLLSGENDALHEVDSAIRRIRQGTYGFCEKSGKRIPPARLRAVPWTRFTREAEEGLEKGGAIRAVKLAPVSSIQGAESDALSQADEPENEELQTRVAGRHQLAETLAEIGNGERAEPSPEPEPDANGRGIATSVRRRISGEPLPRAKAKKRGRAMARRAGRMKAKR